MEGDVAGGDLNFLPRVIIGLVSFLTLVPDNIRYIIMLSTAKIVSCFLFIFFIGAVLGCSITATSSHLGILDIGNDLNGMVPAVAVDPLKGTVPVSEMELAVVLMAIVLVFGVFQYLIRVKHSLLLSGNILERRQLQLQLVLAQLCDYLRNALRRGILQPSVY